MERKNTEQTIKTAVTEWEKAPLHIKAMAGKHVTPLLDALTAINLELRELHMLHLRVELIQKHLGMSPAQDAARRAAQNG